MVRRVLGIVLALALCNGMASETGSQAFRAHQQYLVGRYGEAMRLLHQALKSAAKEADLEGESRVLMDMAQIQMHRYEFATAEELIGSVRVKELRASARLSLVRLRLQLLNQQGKFAEAATLFSESRKTIDDEAFSDVQRGTTLLEGAISLAGSNSADAGSVLQSAIGLLDGNAPGLLLFTQARIAELGKKADAKDLYTQALTLAQQGQHSWIAGQALLHLGQLALDAQQKDVAADYYLRASKLYLQLELDRPFLEAGTAYLALQPDDKHMAAELGNVRARLSPTAKEAVRPRRALADTSASQNP